MHNENWDDLRYVLAVAETGSVLQAAKHLGVNHATVLRRVSAFEDRYGTVLFERTSQGYQLLADCAHIIRAAHSAAVAMQEVHRLASGGRLTLRGTVRVTSTDTLCRAVLPAFVDALQVEEQDLAITLLSSNTHLDLSREQASIAVRPSVRLPEDMVGEVAAELAFAAYAVNDAQTKWLGLTGPLARSIAGAWMDANVASDQITIAADSFLTLQEMAAVGGGIAVLPCFVGDRDHRLLRLPDLMPPMSVPLWVAQHVDAIETQQMLAVKMRLIRFLAEQQELAG
ncbi:LysR family transcriptional regulator [Roseobacter sp. EG26]|uniref:LysR family transcriptional regulator n=1 Tax=Roseobacter sp. EG26 TaxID=3412477 RepID=UPI0026231249|nr:LysR family transcriptional regulator [uncultured Roseobacter sp.]